MAEADTQHDGADTRQISQGLDSSAEENRGDRRKWMDDFFSFCILAGAFDFLPLINVPCAVRVPEPKGYRLRAFAQATAEFFGNPAGFGRRECIRLTIGDVPGIVLLNTEAFRKKRRI